MTDQLSFFDDPPTPPSAPAPRPAGDAAPGVSHSLFLAVAAAPADAERLRAAGLRVDGALGVGGRALESGRLHVSLHALGDYGAVRPDADIARWCRALDAVRGAAFEVVFDRAASFGGDGNPFVFRSSAAADDGGFAALHLALGMALADAGERIKARRFTPHMTLSYGGRRVAEAAVEPVRWRAHEVVLIDSHVGAHRHEVLGRWPLVA